MYKKIFIVLILTCTLFISACGNETLPPVQEFSQKIETPAEPVTQEISSTADTEKLFAGVEDKINKHLNDGTEYAVFLAHPQQSDTPFIFNSKQMRSASITSIIIFRLTATTILFYSAR